jgi:tetratricopeptide (TPR) repeat protein
MARAEWRLGVIPVAIALATYANTLPGDFVFDDVVLIEQGEGLHDFDLRRIFLSSYWGHDRKDENYRPLTLLSYALNWRLGGGAWSFHAVNVLLNAGVALLAYAILLVLLASPLLAALGASLYTVLPIHVEAVANIVGRAELLAGLAIFGAWLAALRQPERGRERLGLAAAAGGITFLGLCAKENVVVAPAVIAAAALFLRRRMPWVTFAASAAAVPAYLVIRKLVLGEQEASITLIDNPLNFTDWQTRMVNAVRLLGLYLWKTVVPIRLAADCSYNQIPVLPLNDPGLWLAASAVIALLAVPPLLLWRRAPLGAFAPVFFLLAIGPVANLVPFLRLGTIFGERLAYTPSFAYPLAVCAVLRWRPFAARRDLVLGLCGFLIAVYAAQAAVRNRVWAERTGFDIRLALDAPRSARGQLKAAEGYMTLWRRARSSTEKEELARNALRHLDESLRIHPRHGRAIAKRGEVFFELNRFSEAAAALTEARSVMQASDPPESEPLILLWRGRCFLHLDQFAEAYADLDLFLRWIGGRDSSQAARGFNFRGLALAGQRRLEEALADFNRGLELRQDFPELWANRGFCRYLLKDVAGALADYQRGFELTKERGLITSPDGDSAVRFLAKIAAVHDDLAKAHRAAGNEAAALQAEAEAARRRAEAAELERGAPREG